MSDLEWKILTIDSVPSFNKIIEVIAEKLSFKNRKLNVLKAESLEEGKEILSKNSDIALILVDIMIEDKDSGLEFIKYIRNRLKNRESRIILRTGYPDSLPEKNIVQNYEIDGYISKEINSQLQIEVAIITAIRSYYQILSTKETLKSLAGSIAHELRNPLNAINLAQNHIKDLVLSSSYNDPDLDNKLISLSNIIDDAVSQANHIIDIILNDLSAKPINPAEFSYLEANKILPEIIEKYGYQTQKQKGKVKLSLSKDNNIFFKVVPDRFKFIIYNLIKNALYYLDQYPDSFITVGTEVKTVNSKEFNVIYVHDTGPGISQDTIPKLFDNFYTAGKKGGTGLGLPFCKRNMNLFGGDIICESEFGNGKNGWTKFSLLFPQITSDELQEIKLHIDYRILLIGNKNDLLSYKSKIEKGLDNLQCDIVGSEKALDTLLRKNQYSLVFVDIENEEIDYLDLIKKIKNYSKEISIIALTSLNRRLFFEKERKELGINIFDGYFSKSYEGNVFYRSVTKYITDYEDDFSYLVSNPQYLEKLKNKKIVIADDEKVNRFLTKRALDNHGIRVTQAKNGKDLLKIFRNSMKNSKSDFDLILTDINMPFHSGDKVALEIRKIEVMNNVDQKNEIPIIAFSGDGSKKDIYHFFKHQMNDYFIKGSSPEMLLKVICSYIN